MKIFNSTKLTKFIFFYHENVVIVSIYSLIYTFTYSLLDVYAEYYNNCVHEKMSHGVKDDIKIVTEFPCLF